MGCKVKKARGAETDGERTGDIMSVSDHIDGGVPAPLILYFMMRAICVHMPQKRIELCLRGSPCWELFMICRHQKGSWGQSENCVYRASRVQFSEHKKKKLFPTTIDIY